MGWGVLAAPGTEFGPCEGECEHIDCKASKGQAATKCYLCDEPIGYDTPYYNTEKGMVHRDCLWEQDDLDSNRC